MKFNKNIQRVLIVICLGLFTAGILIIHKTYCIYNAASTSSGFSSFTLIQQGFAQALPYFLLGIGVLLMVFLMPRLQNITIGPSGFSFALQTIQQSVDAVVKQQNSIQAASVGAGGSGSKAPAMAVAELSVGASIEDTQKGKWGGKAEMNSRELSAKVKKVGTKSYQVQLMVESTDLLNPLAGAVDFHLHSTFANPNPIIAVERGKAILNIPVAYGPFTVGAEADNAKTKLELDLTESFKDADTKK